jgi:hypothetical protein
MLVEYPGLTIVGGLAIAVAIATGAAFFEFATQAVNPTLPLEVIWRARFTRAGASRWRTSAHSRTPTFATPQHRVGRSGFLRCARSPSLAGRGIHSGDLASDSDGE